MNHLPEYCEVANQKAGLPLSEIDVTDMHTWIDSQKGFLKEIETDIRDAKRRVTLKKGPGPKKKVQGPAEGSVSDSDDVGSGVEG